MRQLPGGIITLLFTDIEGSTRLLQQLGSRYGEVLSECRVLLRTAFEQWHGYEVDTQGDAFVVVFPHAAEAVSAAVTLQRALSAHCWPDGVIVRVRIGLHTGEPEATEEGYVGLDVHRASRIDPPVKPLRFSAWGYKGVPLVVRWGRKSTNSWYLENLVFSAILLAWRQ